MADLITGGIRSHPLLTNRDLIGQHPAEAVGVLSPYSMNPNYIGKTWTTQNISIYPLMSAVYVGSGVTIIGTGTVAGVGGFLFRSIDYGRTWDYLSNAFANKDIRALEYLGSSLVLAALGDKHIWRSTDYGLSWADKGAISAFALNTLRYVGWAIVLLGDAGGFVHRSKNYGQTFPFAIGLGSSVLSIEYLDDEIVAVGLANGHIWRSSNFTGLFTWSDRGDVTGSNSPINTITYLGDGVAIAGADNQHIYRTTDFGVTWTDPTGAVVADSKIKTSVYLGNGVVVIGTDAGGRIFRSTDYGLTWTDLGAVTPNAFDRETLTYLGNGVVVVADNGGFVTTSEVAYKTDEISNIPAHIRLLTVSTAIGLNDSLLLGDATFGNISLTLPLAQNVPGREFTIKKINANINTVTVATLGDLIDGAATYVLTVQWQSVTVRASFSAISGSNYFIV